MCAVVDGWEPLAGGNLTICSRESSGAATRFTAEFGAAAARRRKGRALGPVLAVDQGGKPEEPTLSPEIILLGH